MIIDLKKIRQQGLDEQDFAFEYTPANELSALPNVKIASPIIITGYVKLISKSEALIDAEITYALKGECTRCLAMAENTYKAELLEDFSNVLSEAGDNYTYQNDKIDLTKAVEDTILMDMPLNFLCKEDCKGIEF